MKALPASLKFPRSSWTSPASKRASAFTRPSGCSAIISSAIFWASSGLWAPILTAPSASKTFAFPASTIVDLSQGAQIFFGRLVIFLVEIFDPEPFKNFWRWIHVRTVGHETIHLFGQSSPIFQIELTQNQS